MRRRPATRTWPSSSGRRSTGPCGRRCCATFACCRWCGASSFLLSRRVGEGVVEGLEGTVGRDLELEVVAEVLVFDGDRYGVLARVPEQEDANAIRLTLGELTGLGGRRGHHSSFRRGPRGHGISTSFTCATVVRAAT